MLKVLIPVDGSPSSRNSVEKAVSTGIVSGAEVHIMTVISTPHAAPTRNPYMAAEMVTELADANRKYAEAVLEDAKKAITSMGEVKTAVIKEGNPAEEILKYAEEIGSNLIVMGNRGLNTFNKVLLGSVSQKILNHSCCSVLIVKEPK
ncbi:MAG: universal stress protein [Anaerovoracaceae bacterium]|jgi:nucleotide-binding universal stress UspA family protein|nr:universal stress protein [Anaerovoracaceae bacterium]